MLLLRRIHGWLAGGFALGVLVQAYLAGSAMAELGGSGEFRTHDAFGYAAMGLLAIAVFVSALASRATRSQVALAAGLLGLYVVQISLPNARSDMPALAALHPLNAVVLFGIAGLIARRASRSVSPV